ncbi:hypothetical protein [Carnobacterium sp. ISL-102]|nr:hypothetical protein [Carnobacterium sp. ISL-102]MBT2731741.1 hypothetical protein [Carnobacterium sp. ISL-102]
MATEKGSSMIDDVEVGWFTDLEKCVSEVVSYQVRDSLHTGKRGKVQSLL